MIHYAVILHKKNTKRYKKIDMMWNDTKIRHKTIHCKKKQEDTIRYDTIHYKKILYETKRYEMIQNDTIHYVMKWYYTKWYEKIPCTKTWDTLRHENEIIWKDTNIIWYIMMHNYLKQYDMIQNETCLYETIQTHTTHYETKQRDTILHWIVKTLLYHSLRKDMTWYSTIWYTKIWRYATQNDPIWNDTKL